MMTADESKMYAKGLVDLANISAGALIFGHFASAQVVSIGLLVLGILTMLVLYGVAHQFYVAAQRREQPSHEHINAVLCLPARIRAGHGGDCAA
jgi:hypothetical protein